MGARKTDLDFVVVGLDFVAVDLDFVAVDLDFIAPALDFVTPSLDAVEQFVNVNIEYTPSLSFLPSHQPHDSAQARL